MSVNKSLALSTVQHQLDLQRYSSGIIAQIRKLLDEVDRDLQEQLAGRLSSLGDSFTTQRLNRLLDEIRGVNAEATTLLGDSLSQSLNDVLDYETGWTAKQLENALPVDFSIVRPSAEQLKAIVSDLPLVGATLPEELSALADARFRAIQGALRLGLTEGETVDQLVRRVIGTKAAGYADGVLAASRGQAAALVRTAVNHTTNAARMDLYQANSDVVAQWQFHATLDNRTTLVCASLDGQTFDLGEGPRPPRHFNCRSVAVPITKSWKELGLSAKEADAGTRASLDGQVPDTMDFTDFMRGQVLANPAAAEEWFKGAFGADGPAMMDAFQANPNMSLADFTKRGGKPLTLQQLATKEGVELPAHLANVPEIQAAKAAVEEAKIAAAKAEAEALAREQTIKDAVAATQDLDLPKNAQELLTAKEQQQALDAATDAATKAAESGASQAEVFKAAEDAYLAEANASYSAALQSYTNSTSNQGYLDALHAVPAEEAKFLPPASELKPALDAATEAAKGVLEAGGTEAAATEAAQKAAADELEKLLGPGKTTKAASAGYNQALSDLPTESGTLLKGADFDAASEAAHAAAEKVVAGGGSLADAKAAAKKAADQSLTQAMDSGQLAKSLEQISQGYLTDDVYLNGEHYGKGIITGDDLQLATSKADALAKELAQQGASPAKIELAARNAIKVSLEDSAQLNEGIEGIASVALHSLPADVPIPPGKLAEIKAAAKEAADALNKAKGGFMPIDQLLAEAESAANKKAAQLYADAKASSTAGAAAGAAKVANMSMSELKAAVKAEVGALPNISVATKADLQQFLANPTPAAKQALIEKLAKVKADLAEGKKAAKVVELPNIKVAEPGQPQPVVTLDGKTWKNVGGQAGSNPGGLYQAPDGTKYYVKFPKKSLEQLREEVVASRFYAAAGVGVPELQFVTLDGKLGVASKIIPGSTGNATMLAKALGVRQGFAMDAWLANWDVVGASFDNIILDGEGGAFRIDLGGSLRYRAQGSPKGNLFGPTVKELQSLLDAGVNANSAAVFGNLSEQEIVAQIKQLAKVFTDQVITDIANSVPGLENPGELIGTLRARRDFMLKAAKAMEQAAKDAAENEKYLNTLRPVNAPKISDYKVVGKINTYSRDYDDAQAAETYWNSFENQRKWRSGLTRKELGALQDYTNGRYDEVNGMLREQPAGYKLTGWGAELEKALDRAVVPEDLTLWRGFSARPQLYAKLEKLEAGGLYTDKAFLSTAATMGYGWDGNVILELKVPKGSRGFGWAQPFSRHPSEEEIIGQRGLKWRVISKEKLTNGNRKGWTLKLVLELIV